jgi:hypothetical protein
VTDPIPAVPDAEGTETSGDALPADLDLSAFVGAYQFPNVQRRRVPAVMYLVSATLLAALYLFTRHNDPVLVTRSMLFAAIGLALLGVHHFATAWDLKVTETDALVAASTAVGFPIGHASAQLSGRGLRSRPTWRVLVYSADEPPTKRGFVLIDGVEGAVVEQLVEVNPEDWSQYDS